MFSKKALIQFLTIVFVLLSISLLAACEEESDLGVGVVPTIAEDFQLPTPRPTFTRLPTLTPPTNPTATQEVPIRSVVVFDDGFKSGWGFETEDLFAELVEENRYDGTQSIKVTPRLASSRFYIVANSDLNDPIRREDILLVSFYLNGGPSAISFDDITVTAQGSNTNIFWSENDRSAFTTAGATFAETQLSFLGISVIPAETWARVEFSPLDQEFDPVYRNFTGIYLTNSGSLLTPYYIDRIEILMVEES
ncbi:MAG: hypothetical protein AAF902_00780 [Chloroflexota bacterium]